jgi:hypothetical protein
MPSQSAKSKRRDRADYGFARARDLAFDAVQSLWHKRHSDGMKQIEIAKALDRSPAWVNRSLRGPGNWTLRTFGELVEALGGEIELSVHALEDPLPICLNYHAYAGYELPDSFGPPVLIKTATVQDKTTIPAVPPLAAPHIKSLAIAEVVS